MKKARFAGFFLYSHVAALLLNNSKNNLTKQSKRSLYKKGAAGSHTLIHPTKRPSETFSDGLWLYLFYNTLTMLSHK